MVMDRGLSCQAGSSNSKYNQIKAQTLLEDKWLFSGIRFRYSSHLVDIFYQPSDNFPSINTNQLD